MESQAFNTGLQERVSAALTYIQHARAEYDRNSALLDEYGDQITATRTEQGTCEQAKETMAEIRKIITKSSLEYCENLATMALRDVFQLDAKVQYSPDDGKFLLRYANGHTSDLLAAESGGIKTVVSFVLTVYLVIKSGARRIMFFDEQWTQVSDESLPRFLEFVRMVCKELNFDILLITHDSRITLDDADHAFFMESGKSKRLK